MRFDQHDQILKRTVKPAVLPVTLAESKSDLREDRTIEDALISSLIAASTDYLQAPNGAINKAFITQTWELSVPHTDRYGRVDLPVTPVQSIESITYFDGSNVQQTLNVADFHLYGEEDWAYIVPKENKSWPSTYVRLDAITITFKAGFGDLSSDVPESIRHAIRLLVVHWFENRGVAVVGTIVAELPAALQSLISINRKGWVA